ncbi:hypothetical protein ACT009_09810 [Sphingomonas sp. Tas61C01]|uniref:hypothetical protein n=1 Tax=Sphingomonas sp. Tas61C01 TaxID=3458297 RepID=UPI00403E6B74
METRYRLTLSLAITDPSALWAAAAALAMNSPYMTMDDVIETIGPIDAPQIDDCLALLMQPERFGGCDIHGLDIAIVQDPAPSAHDDLPPSTRHDVEARREEARRERFAFETNQAIAPSRVHDIEPQGKPPMRGMPAATGTMLDLR